MDFLQKPPQRLLDLLPEGARGFLEGPGWWAVLGVGALLILLLLWLVLGRLLKGGSGGKQKRAREPLEEDLAGFPAAAPSTGDRRLTVEGVPVRLRLVVLAPAGVAFDINPDTVNKLLDRVLLGLGDIAAHDEPQVRIWPKQLSYEGFANAFRRNTAIPEGENEPSRWVLVAGRAKIAGNSVMIGLGLQASKETTVGRKTLEPHEWPTVFRIKVRE